ncbi:WSC domain-containing protein [Cucumis melo var. makuwa]|uniref:WSC domain-containing protein n=1 Tax=Cucumis melo var. makuwa TaxID=1194695 RepID=A0A5A7U9M3_CUCMM|nr:WSC domain-containing protein [Cucumis melo var. makuwa]TYK21368.1 WSC domain-containing protein [Cucumis melo var. makuwa]
MAESVIPDRLGSQKRLVLASLYEEDRCSSQMVDGRSESKEIGLDLVSSDMGGGQGVISGDESEVGNRLEEGSMKNG